MQPKLLPNEHAAGAAAPAGAAAQRPRVALSAIAQLPHGLPELLATVALLLQLSGQGCPPAHSCWG
jgi:hypothetical protein